MLKKLSLKPQFMALMKMKLARLLTKSIEITVEEHEEVKKKKPKKSLKQLFRNKLL